MKIRNVITPNNRLIRTIPYEDIEHYDALACSVLISYEFKWQSKVHINFYGHAGSLFIEYCEHSISSFTRGDFNENSTILMVVTLIPTFGNSHTSTISGSTVLGCFNEYLRLSDQRKSIIMKHKKGIFRIDELPESAIYDKNGWLSLDTIDVNSTI